MRVGLRSGSERVILYSFTKSDVYSCSLYKSAIVCIRAVITVWICAQAGLPQISVYISWSWGQVLIPVHLSKESQQADSSVHLMWQLTPVREWQVWTRNKKTQMQPKSPERERENRLWCYRKPYVNNNHHNTDERENRSFYFWTEFCFVCVSSSSRTSPPQAVCWWLHPSNMTTNLWGLLWGHDGWKPDKDR